MRLIWAILLILANGLFVAMEFALIVSLPSRMEGAAANGSRLAKMGLRAMGDLGEMLAGCQLGITLASLALGAVAEPAIADLLEPVLESMGLSEGYVHPVALAVALTIVVYLHLVIGEMVPKGLALAGPEKTLMAVIVPGLLFVRILKPLIFLLNVMAVRGAALFGAEAADELKQAATPAEFQSMLSDSFESGLLEPDEHQLLVGALGFLEESVDNAMIDRDEIVSLSANATVEEYEDLIHNSGHSRILVTDIDIDHVRGFVHAKDLLTVSDEERSAPISKRMIRKTLSVAPAMPLGEVLLAMRRSRRHVVLVADGSTTMGLITLEDVLESIVGEIVDETDRESLY